jgi:acylphosphatase
MNAARRQVRVRYEGEVQGVGFRYVTQKIANQLGVQGGVENLPDGAVDLVAEGPEDLLKQLLLQISVSRLGAYIASQQVRWGDSEGLSGFYYR